MSKDKLTPIAEVGEFGLIKEISAWCAPFEQADHVLYGIGDDCAVLAFDDTQYQLISTDMLTEGIHFDLSYTPLKHLGYKAVVSNVSDICAMNGKADTLVLSISLSSKYSIEAVEEIYKGVLSACKTYDVAIVGGDTTSSKAGMTISISVLGKVAKEDLCKRSGAKVNDLLVLSGDAGAAYMGLQILEREKKVFQQAPQAQPRLEGYDYLLQRQLRPEARTDVIQELKKLNIRPTSMIDVSDGLSSEVMHLAERSGVAFALYDEKLPIDPLTRKTALEFNLDPSTAALNGGEDYELLFSLSPSDFDKIKNNPNYSVIGHAQAKADGNVLIDSNGHQHDLKAQGWSSFSEE